MEATLEASSEITCGWNLAKLNRAKRMLAMGFSPNQIGARLGLSIAQIEEFETDAADEPKEIKPATETHEEWRRRMAKTIEKKVVNIAEKHIDSVTKLENAEGDLVLDEKLMGTVVDASQIAHKWLKSGEEGIRTLSLNFSALAQIEPDMKTIQAVTLEMENPPPREAMGDEAGDDWLA